METILHLAKTLAIEAGKEIMARRFNLEISMKPDHSVVTDADIASDNIIHQGVQKHFPDHSYLSEESGLDEKDSDFIWIVDPLDGTQNYAKELPFFNISIGVKQHDQMVVGVVHSPVLNETFWAVKDQGAYLNGKKIIVSDQTDADKSIIILDTAMSKEALEESMRLFYGKILKNVHRMRYLGSAALEICYAAAGRFDACLYNGLHDYDFAAASVILSESGGKLTNFENEFNLNDRHVLASNGHLHNTLLGCLSPD